MGKKGISVMKRPAAKAKAGNEGRGFWWSKEAGEDGKADEEADAEEASVMKRPAGQNRPAGAKEEPEAEDQEVSERRDRMKDYYFQEARKNGKLDAEVREAWEKARGNRKQETAVVNSVMVKQKGSATKFVPDPHAPAFREVLIQFSRTWYRETQKALPKSIMTAKLGGPRMFEEALENGEIKEVAGKDGMRFYAYTSMSIAKETG